MIHSKMVVNISNIGPTKKNMPLELDQYACSGIPWIRPAYATPASPAAPPQPIKTIAKVNVEITKLCKRQHRFTEGYSPDTNPTKPIGVGLAKRFPTSGVFGVR